MLLQVAVLLAGCFQHVSKLCNLQLALNNILQQASWPMKPWHAATRILTSRGSVHALPGGCTPCWLHSTHLEALQTSACRPCLCLLVQTTLLLCQVTWAAETHNI